MKLLKIEGIIIISLLLILCNLVTIDAKSNEDMYQEKLAKLKDDDVKGHYELGLWCKGNKFYEEAQYQFEKVITLNPDHENARKELGYVKHKNEWITQKEKEELIAKEKGLVKYGDKWITKQEMEVFREKERKSLGWDFEYKTQTEHFLVYASTSEEQTKYICQIIECHYSSYMKCFGKDLNLSNTHSPFKVKLFKDQNEINQKCPEAKGDPGCYNIKTRYCQISYNQISKIPYSICVHEVTHQLNHELAKAKFPVWIDEGLACYFESTKIKDNKMMLGEIALDSRYGTLIFTDNFNLDDVLENLEKVLTISGKEWRKQQDPKLTQLQYTTAWLLVHFLFHYEDGRYKEGFLKYLVQAKKGYADVKMFESSIGKIDNIKKELLEYNKNLKIKK
jgi:hypothetical protein